MFIYVIHTEVVPLMKTFCLQQLGGEGKKAPTQLCLFFHMTAEQIQLLLGTLLMFLGKYPVAGICIIIFRAIVGGLGLLTEL